MQFEPDEIRRELAVAVFAKIVFYGAVNSQSESKEEAEKAPYLALDKAGDDLIKFLMRGPNA